MTIKDLIFILIIFTFILIVCISYFNINFFKNHRQKIISIIQIAFISLIVFISFGAMLKAQWGPDDDQEIIYYLGSDGKTSINEFFPILLSTEVGNFGSSPRVRPVYQSLRILETIFWGDNVQSWYAVRILICIVSLFLYWKAFEHFYSPVVAGVATLLIFSHVSTSDLFARLGPGETYGYLAVALFLWIYIKILKNLSQRKKSKSTELQLLFISYLTAIGVKESLFILVAPLAYLGYLAFKKKDKVLRFVVCVLFIITIILISGLLRVLLLEKQDFYAVEIFNFTRLSKLIGVLSSSYSLLFLLINILVSLLSLRYIKENKLQKKDQQSLLLHLKIIWISVFIIVSQYIVYLDALFTGNRYSFPSTISVVLMFTSLAYCLKIIYFQQKTKFPIKILTLTKTITLTLLILTISYSLSKKLEVLSQTSSDLAVWTQDYTKTMKKVANEIKNYHSHTPIILEIDCIRHYEQLFGMYRFMRYFGVNNEIAIHLIISEPKSLEIFSVKLYKQLYDHLFLISENGSPDFVPLPIVDNKTCLSVDVHNPTYEKELIDINKVFCTKHLSRNNYY